MLGWVDRISKNDDVAAMHFAIRKKMIPDAVSAITQFIDQQIIPDEKRVLHGLRRNLECLHDEGDDEYRDYHCCQQGLQGGRPIGLMLFYTHDRLRTRLRSPFKGSGRDARYSSTWRAASCSAFFVVEPSARPTNSGFSSRDCKRASTVNVLLFSGPPSFTSTYTRSRRHALPSIPCTADFNS